jgi:hypothetical protein
MHWIEGWMGRPQSWPRCSGKKSHHCHCQELKPTHPARRTSDISEDFGDQLIDLFNTELIIIPMTPLLVGCNLLKRIGMNNTQLCT